MQHAIFIPPFGPLADPRRLADVAVAAEEAGWDGVFLWDHVLRVETPDVLDPWVCLAAMGAATSRVRLGPMVTPIVRRRPIKLAREVLSLDLLTGGRVTLGMGLGVDSGGELTRFGEVVDAPTRGRMLDEGAAVVATLLAGDTVEHVGEFFTVDGIELRPPTVQRPRPPMWFASRGDARKPVRRAARYEGVFCIEVDADQYARVVDTVIAERGSLDGFDLVVRTTPGDPAPEFTRDSAAWCLQAFPAVVDLDELDRVIAAGPPD